MSSIGTEIARMFFCLFASVELGMNFEINRF